LKLADFAAIDMGDDGGIFVRRDQVELVQRELSGFFQQFGLVMTVENPVYKIEHIEFCQTHPVFDGIKYRMQRNPHSCTTKDATSLDAINNEKELCNYLASIGKGGLSLSGGIPMLQEYYASMIRESNRLMKGKKCKYKKLTGGLYYLSKRMDEHYVDEITTEARISFYHAFNILPEMQRIKEKEYKNINLQWCSKNCTAHGERAVFTTKE